MVSPSKSPANQNPVFCFHLPITLYSLAVPVSSVLETMQDMADGAQTGS